MADTEPDRPASWGIEEPNSRHGRWLILAGIIAAIAVAAGVVVFVQRKVEETKVAWPRSVEGRPPGLGRVNEAAADVTVGADPGVYAWNDTGGWHLWVVHGDEIGAVKGKIVSDKPVTSADPAVPDTGTVRVTGETVTFDLPATPGLVGVNFTPGFYAESLTFTIEGPDGPLAAETITLGRRTPVKQVPVIVRKVPEDQAATS